MSKITKASYSFVEKPENEFYSVRLNDGLYKGVIATYGKIAISEDPATLTATLKFTYILNEVPAPMSKSELEASPEFKGVLGDVLAHILHTAFEKDEYRLGGGLLGKNHGRKSPVNDPTEAGS